MVKTSRLSCVYNLRGCFVVGLEIVARLGDVDLETTCILKVVADVFYL